jgi:hypothetical protein
MEIRQISIGWPFEVKPCRPHGRCGNTRWILYAWVRGCVGACMCGRVCAFVRSFVCAHVWVCEGVLVCVCVCGGVWVHGCVPTSTSRRVGARGPERTRKASGGERAEVDVGSAVRGKAEFWGQTARPGFLAANLGPWGPAAPARRAPAARACARARHGLVGRAAAQRRGRARETALGRCAQHAHCFCQFPSHLQQAVQIVLLPVGKDFLNQGRGGVHVELTRPQHAQHAHVLAAKLLQELLAAGALRGWASAT